MKGKALIMGALFSFLFFFGIERADAESVAVNVNYFDNLYVTKSVGDNTFSSKARRYLVEGQTTYCVEPGKGICICDYTGTYDISLLGLNSANIDYFELISHFGYDYPGHNNKYYYAAAQEMMWEVIGATDIYWTTLDNGMGDAINIQPYKDNIRKLIDDFHTKPSFDMNILEYGTGQSVEIDDLSSVISNYTVIDSGVHSVSVSGNKLLIDLEPTFIGESQIKLNWNLDGGLDSKMYYRPDSQTLAAFHSDEERTTSFTIKTHGGIIKLNKLDIDNESNIPRGEATLEGAVYELYDSNDNFIFELNTDEYGVATTSEIPYGEYKLIETKPPVGYNISTEAIIFMIDEKVEIVNALDKVINKNIIINKKYGSSVFEEYFFEPDVLFEIYDVNDILHKKIKTDSAGFVSINLPYGTYTFKQMTSKEYYEKVADFIVEVFDKEEIIFNLLDEEIPRLPQTFKNDYTNIIVFISLGIGLLFGFSGMIKNDKKYII